MIDHLQQSPFLTADAVTAWDTWFRWREDGRLRDRSVDATWLRVAETLSAAEPAHALRWTGRFFDAQSRWQLLLDERLLAHAGTARSVPLADPVAIVNPAMFVASPFSADARFDFDAFRSVAALAVRALDNVRLRDESPPRTLPDLRIGMIGLADTLVLLGKRYDRASGRVMAGEIARALAEGCLIGSLRLARERGAFPGADPAQLQRVHRFPVPSELLAEAGRCGIRHGRLTSISSQPRLSMFANNVADALDPVDAGTTTQATHGARRVPYVVAAARSARTGGALPANAIPASVSLSARIQLRGAVQPWIDSPIDYPFRVGASVSAQSADFLHRIAAAHRLGEMTLAND
jgi:ribonucleoside-diphosphate reductase alpha chain